MDIRGTDIQYSVTGNGHPFIWGHGLTWNRAAEDEGGLFDWRMLEDITRLVRYDARGHGASGGTANAAEYQWSELALDMLGVADTLGIDRFVAGGASMGCATTLYAALAAPERVEAMVLVIPPTAWETRAQQVALYNTMAGLVEAQGLPVLVEMARQQAQTGIFAREHPEMIEWGFRCLGAMNETTAPAVFRGAGMSDFPPREAVRTLPMPTLILAWAEDEGHPVSTAEALQELLPDSRLSIANTVADIRAWPRRIHAFLSQLVLTAPARHLPHDATTTDT